MDTQASSDPAAPGSTDSPEPDPVAADRPDPEALAALRAGDRAAWQRTLRPLLPSLLAFARRLAGDPHWAEDLVQETLIRAMRGIATFRGECSVRSWLFRIQFRLAAPQQRWRRRQPPPAADCEVPVGLDASPEFASQERELRERLDEAMERLTAKQRTALHLRSVEGLSYRAIATVMESSPTAVRMLVLAARRQVLQRLGRHLAP